MTLLNPHKNQSPEVVILLVIQSRIPLCVSHSYLLSTDSMPGTLPPPPHCSTQLSLWIEAEWSWRSSMSRAEEITTIFPPHSWNLFPFVTPHPPAVISKFVLLLFLAGVTCNSIKNFFLEPSSLPESIHSSSLRKVIFKILLNLWEDWAQGHGNLTKEKEVCR